MFILIQIFLTIFFMSFFYFCDPLSLITMGYRTVGEALFAGKWDLPVTSDWSLKKISSPQQPLNDYRFFRAGDSLAPHLQYLFSRQESHLSQVGFLGAKDDPELLIHLLPSPNLLGFQEWTTCLFYGALEIQPSALCMLGEHSTSRAIF